MRNIEIMQISFAVTKNDFFAFVKIKLKKVEINKKSFVRRMTRFFGNGLLKY